VWKEGRPEWSERTGHPEWLGKTYRLAGVVGMLQHVERRPFDQQEGGDKMDADCNAMLCENEQTD
jgi:hypothetical protein